jgi:hypothetical protein
MSMVIACATSSSKLVVLSICLCLWSIAGETYTPMISHLFQLCEAMPGATVLESVWIVDCPNHGDAAVLNKDVIDSRYSENCGCRCYDWLI